MLRSRVYWIHPPKAPCVGLKQSHYWLAAAGHLLARTQLWGPFHLSADGRSVECYLDLLPGRNLDCKT